MIVAGVATQSAIGDALGDRTTQGDPGLATGRPYLASLSVANLDGAVRWYSDVLGFRETRRLDLPDHALRIGFLQLNGFRLELIEFKGSVAMTAIQSKFPGVDDRAKVQGFGKLGFAVRDIEAAASSLRAKKAKFVRDVTHEKETGETWLMIEDMDGNCLQFFEVGK
jgi:catechol 2,3-dioxygenase-like lactoylglutathione lyase family enzyme